MKIIIDLMSGDNAPSAQLEGAINAAEMYKDVTFVLVGNRSIVDTSAKAMKLDVNKSNIEIVHSEGIITMEDTALSVVREKSNSSMGIALRLLAEGKGDALISSGNTGALHAGSTLIVRRIKGVRKSAIATILPYSCPTMLLDSGANTEIDTETYIQFAKMGTVYMKKIHGIDSPRVGLINIGTEKNKGTKLMQEAYTALSETAGINFVGNVEAKELPYGGCDVAVCDGVIGNIVLKLTEGLGSYFSDNLKSIFGKNPLTKASALGVYSGLRDMKKRFDASEYGGAPLLGLSKTVIKAHGCSDAKAIVNAVNQAIKCVGNSVNYEISTLLGAVRTEEKND